MSTVVVRSITRPDDAVLQALPPLFEAMHVEMAAQGMLLHLAEQGAHIWLTGITAGLERFGRLAVAETDGHVVGFAHAGVKLAPEHLGGERVGHIAHVYVVPQHRRYGVAGQLATSLHEWLQAKQVASIELQVVQGNEAGRAFWKSLGYAPELMQLRKV